MKRLKKFLSILSSFSLLINSIAPVVPLIPQAFAVTPVLFVVTPVPTSTNDTTPDFTFSSDVDGSITYAGDCKSATNTATVGSNTITLDSDGAGAALSEATHTNCDITVTNNGDPNTLEVPDFTVDVTAPTVSGVGSTTNDGTYKIGDTVAVTVAFSENVNVSGTPQLLLETGGTDRNVDYTSGTGTNTLTFAYTVQDGDSSSDLDYVATDSLTLNGGTIKDIAGNDGVLTLANPGTAGSLGANKAILIDGVVPSITDANVSISGASGIGGEYKIGDTVTATWNNTASGDNNTDINSVTVNFSQFGAGSAVSATNGSDTWTATYQIAAGTINNVANRNVSVTATDPAGNTTTTADTTNATVDNQAPTVTVDQKSDQADPVNNSPINFTAVFSEAVTGFDETDVALNGNGSPAAVVTTSDNTTFNISVSGMTDGAVLASIPMNKAQDIAGNNNIASTSTDNTITYDTTAPIAFTAGSVGTTGGNVVAGKWNATNTGVNITVPVDNDSTLNGGTIQIQAEADGTFENVGSAYTILAGDLNTNKTLSLSAAQLEGIAGFSNGDNVTFRAIIADLAANATTGTESATSLDIDQTAPTADVAYSINHDVKSGDLLTITATFNEAVLDSPAPKISISGANTLAAIDMTKTDPTHYTYVHTVGAGNGTATVALSVGQDITGNEVDSTPTSGATFTVDNNAPANPAITSVAADNKINDSEKDAITVIGTAEADSLVSVTLSDGTNNVTQTQQLTAGATGYSITLDGTLANPAALIDGTIHVSVTATDAATNTSIAETLDATQDTGIPAVPGVPTAAGDNIINSSEYNSFTVVGTAEADSLVTVTLTDVDGDTVSGTEQLTGGATNYSIIFDGNDAAGGDDNGFTDGDIFVAVTSQDAALNVSNEQDTTVSQDTSAPSLNSVSIASSNTTAGYAKVGDTVTISFTSNEDIQTPTVTIAGHPATVSGSNSSWSASYQMILGDTEGLVGFTVSFADIAGNADTQSTTSDSSSVTFDSIVPSVPASLSLTNPVNNANQTAIALAGTGETNATVNYTITDGTNNATGSGIVVGGVIDIQMIDVSSLLDGTLTVSVTLTDLAGNVSAVGTAMTAKDVVLPTVTVNQAAGQADPTKNSPINFTAVFSEAVTGFDETDVALNGNGSPAAVVTTSDNTTFNISVSGMTDGDVLASIAANKATDIAGNGNIVSTSTDNTVNYDTTAPAVAIASPVTGDYVNAAKVITFTDDEITSPQCSIDNTTFVSCTSGVTTLADVTGFAALPEGNFTLYLQDTDTAGNTGTTSQINIVKDTIAPTAAVTYSINHEVKSGDVQTITATFSETIIGTPQIALSGLAVVAATNMTATANSLVWTYDYTVGSGDGTENVTIGNVTDLAGNVVVGVPTSGPSFIIDNTAPVLQSFTSTNSSGTYESGTTVNITAVYSEVLGSGSTMTVVFNTDVPSSATLGTVVGSTLTGTYTVGAIGSHQNSIGLAVSSITSQTAVDIAGNIQSTVTLPITNITSSRTIVVSTVLPGQVLLVPNTTVSSTKPEVVVGNIGQDATITIPAGVTNATMDLSGIAVTSGGITTVTINNAITINDTTGIGNVSMIIPAGTVISGSFADWTNSKLNLPTLTGATINLPAPKGYKNSVNSIIEIGFGDVPITLSRAVRLFFPGRTANKVGYMRNGVFTQITATCTEDTQAAGDALPAGGDCSINVGPDLVVYTKHFTKFITYVTEVDNSNGGGGGSNPGSSTEAPSCGAVKPGSAPTILFARVTGINEITLTWSKADDPVTYYLVTYGTSPGAQTYGNPNVGDQNTTSYTITNLSGGVQYYFRVRGGNTCRPGDYSNEISETTTGGVVEGPAEGFAAGVLGTQTATNSGEIQSEATPSGTVEYISPTPVEKQGLSSGVKAAGIIVLLLLIGSSSLYLFRRSQNSL